MTIIEKILELFVLKLLVPTNRFNDSYEQFEADFIYRNAICLCLLQIGGVVRKVIK